MRLASYIPSRHHSSVIRCVAKNSLGHSDGSITLHQVAAPTLPTTTTTTTTTLAPGRRQRQKGLMRMRVYLCNTTPGHHRKRWRESRRHSYALAPGEESHQLPQQGEGEAGLGNRVRIIHRDPEPGPGAEAGAERDPPEEK